MTERRATIAVTRDGWTGHLQLALWSGDGGYRLAGPKFNGSGEALLEHRLTERDAQELRRVLDWVFPPPVDEEDERMYTSPHT